MDTKKPETGAAEQDGQAFCSNHWGMAPRKGGVWVCSKNHRNTRRFMCADCKREKGARAAQRQARLDLIKDIAERRAA